jgi:hypothetical protein
VGRGDGTLAELAEGREGAGARAEFAKSSAGVKKSRTGPSENWIDWLVVGAEF